MGAAATQRGDMSIRRSLHSEHDQARSIENLALALAVAEECNGFVREAQAYLVEPKGLRQSTVERAKTRRGWIKRSEQLVVAHCSWVDVDTRNVMGYHTACVKRAKAAYELLQFALGSWTIPAHIKVPRAAMA